MIKYESEAVGERVDFKNSRGQRIVALTARPSHSEDNGIVVMPPAYERQIYHYGILSRYALRNCYSSLRFDMTNHVGASEGDIYDFSISGLADDIEAALAFTREVLGDEKVFLLGSSIAARASIRALHHMGIKISGLTLLLPAVHLQYTWRQALGMDPIEEWESGRVTDPRGICRVLHHDIAYECARDASDNYLATLESSAAELAGLDFPVTALCASKDDWIDADEVIEAVQSHGAQHRSVVVLQGSSHDISNNPPVFRAMAEEFIRSLNGEVQRESVRHLDFDEIVETAVTEKKWARVGYQDLTFGEES